MIKLTYAQAFDIKETLEEVLCTRDLSLHTRENILSQLDFLEDLLAAGADNER